MGVLRWVPALLWRYRRFVPSPLRPPLLVMKEQHGLPPRRYCDQGHEPVEWSGRRVKCWFCGQKGFKGSALYVVEKAPGSDECAEGVGGLGHDDQIAECRDLAGPQHDIQRVAVGIDVGSDDSPVGIHLLDADIEGIGSSGIPACDIAAREETACSHAGCVLYLLDDRAWVDCGIESKAGQPVRQRRADCGGGGGLGGIRVEDHRHAELEQDGLAPDEPRRQWRPAASCPGPPG